MRRSTLAKQRLLAVFFAGLFFFFSPVISVFDRPGLLFGLPILYLYLFGVWAVLIAAMAWIVGGYSE